MKELGVCDYEYNVDCSDSKMPNNYQTGVDYSNNGDPSLDANYSEYDFNDNALDATGNNVQSYKITTFT